MLYLDMNKIYFYTIFFFVILILFVSKMKIMLEKSPCSIRVELRSRSRVMVLYSLDWTSIGFLFILLTVNLFRHLTLIEHGL